MNESSTLLSVSVSAFAVILAYLIGSIPFGYLIVYWVKGVDIRTVGSGNTGATNVGRVLGLPYFALVLVLDGLKGYVPAAGLPWLVSRSGIAPVADLAVLSALAAILGHTFSVYLRFQGGKGIATSLGAVVALDPISCSVAILVFLGVIGVTRYVSLSALVSSLAFVVAHFAREAGPLRRDHLAMSLFTVGVLALVFFRHRANIARLWAGTESRINLAGKRSRPNGAPHPSGSIRVILVLALAVFLAAVAGALAVYRHASQPIVATAGPWTLRETDRVDTGQQRVDRIAFAAGGTRLAATCPRYDRVVLYSVQEPARLEPLEVVKLAGRPEAIAAAGDRFVVLVSPSGDRKHIERGWWEVFDKNGRPVGERILTGYYPDDLAVSPDQKHLVVISSGRAEGDSKKPAPTLEVIALDFAHSRHQVVGRLGFDDDDDLERISISATGRCAAVLLAGSHQVAAIDLSAPELPRLVSRTKPTGDDGPYLSYSAADDWIMMPAAGTSEAVAIEQPFPPGTNSAAASHGDGADARPCYLICTRQKDSVLELLQSTPRVSLGRLPLCGPFHLGRTRPTSVAFAPELGLAAVSTRTGTIHLISLRARLESGASPGNELSSVRPETGPLRR